MSQTMDPVSPPDSPASLDGSRKPGTVSGLHDLRGLRGRHGHNSHVRHTIPTSERYASASSSQDPRYSVPFGVTSSSGLPFRSTALPLRPDELSPRSAGSSALNDIVASNAGNANSEADGAEEDIGNDAQSDTNSDSAASDSVSNSSSSAELSSPPMASRPAPPYRGPRPSGGFASPSDTPGTDAKKDTGSTRPPTTGTRTGQSSARFLLVEASLVIEEISDFDSDNGRIQVILPYAIEEAESEREQVPDPNRHRSGKLNHGQARRRSSARYVRPPPEIDRSVMNGLQGFSLRADSDEEALLDEDDEDASDVDEAAHELFRLKHREERRRRRMTSGSISKRTISESIGSDTDNEDLYSTLDASEVGSSARRLRRRIGDRHSLQFPDPPPPRIEELEEPDTTDNEDDVKELVRDGETLARELPYYTLDYISMEVDSP